MFIERHGGGPRHYFGIHGWSGDRRTFLPLMETLPADATFWSADLPGCGRSPEPSIWDLDAIVTEVAGAIRTPVTLVGNCSGAILSLLVAQRVPDRIERLILIDAFAGWPWYFRVFTSPRIGRYAYFTTFANPIGRWMTNLSLSGKRGGGTHLTNGFSETNHESTYRYLILLRDAGDAKRFASLEMPVDIVYGERTFQGVKDSAQTWRRIVPQARTYCLRGAGHLAILEATAQLSEILFQESLCPIAS